MSKPVLAYGICGEGLGHAARSIALIERLEPELSIHIFTFGDAFNFFRDRGFPNLHRIPGLSFVKKQQKIDWPASIIHLIHFVRTGQDHLSHVTKIWDTIRPDIAVTDFEPLVPRVALQKKIPVLGVDNQAKISRCRLRDLPIGLKLYQAVFSSAIEWLVPRQVPRVVSCFHPEFCTPVKPLEAVVGPMLRSSITRLSPTDGGFALVYYKDVVGECLFRVAKILGIRTVVYGGCEHAHNWPQFEFHPHGEGFPEALAACSVLVCPAGNQLLGEAAFLGKKTICIPQRGQYEQSINGFYMEKIGLGKMVRNPASPEREVAEFLKGPKPTKRLSTGVEDVANLVLAMRKKSSRSSGS
jgi:uncharacterized protein (TIGR00661 family)